MEHLEIDRNHVGLMRGYSFKGNCKFWVVSLVCKEWGDTSGAVGGVIIYELGERELGGPIVLEVVHMNS